MNAPKLKTKEPKPRYRVIEVTDGLFTTWEVRKRGKFRLIFATFIEAHFKAEDLNAEAKTEQQRTNPGNQPT